MRNCEASRFVPTSCGSGKEAAAYSVKLRNDERDGDGRSFIEFPPADTICVIARLRLLASRDRAATARPTRSIFCGRKLPSGNFLRKTPVARMRRLRPSGYLLRRAQAGRNEIMFFIERGNRYTSFSGIKYALRRYKIQKR